MALSNSLIIVDDSSQAYAELWNQNYHSRHGNYVITGCGVTPNGTPPTLEAAGNHAIVAAGSVFVNGDWVTVAGDNVDLSSEYAGMSAGQSRFVYIYIDSAGAVQHIAGTVATTGSQYPPLFSALAEEVVVLGRVLLTHGDTTVDAADITEMRQYAAQGGYFSDDVWMAAGKYLFFDGTNAGDGIRIAVGTSGVIDADAGLHELLFRHYSSNDYGGSVKTLMKMDYNNEIVIIGNSTDLADILFNRDSKQNWGGGMNVLEGPHASIAWHDTNGYLRLVTQGYYDDTDNRWEYTGANDFGLLELYQDELAFRYSSGTPGAGNAATMKNAIAISNSSKHLEVGPGDNQLGYMGFNTRAFFGYTGSYIAAWGDKDFSVALGNTTYASATEYLRIKKDASSIGFKNAPVIIESTSYIETDTFSSNYDATVIDGNVTLNSTSWFTSNEKTLISYSSNDYDRMILDMRKIRIEMEATFDVLYSDGIDGNDDTTEISVRWQYSIDGGSAWVTVDTDTGISTAGGDTDKSVTFTTTYVDVDGDTITGDVMVRLQVQHTAGPGADDDTINFGGGSDTPTCQWRHAIKSL